MSTEEPPCPHAHLVPAGEETPCAMRRRLIAEAAQKRNFARAAKLLAGGVAAAVGLADPNTYMEVEYNGQKIKRVVPVWAIPVDSSNKDMGVPDNTVDKV